MWTATDILTAAYPVAGFVALLGYIPQVRRFVSDQDVCLRTPLLTWTLWAMQTVIFFLYAVLVNGDRLFILSTTLFMAATLLCYGILLFQKFDLMVYWRFVRRKVVVGVQTPIFRPVTVLLLVMGSTIR